MLKKIAHDSKYSVVSINLRHCLVFLIYWPYNLYLTVKISNLSFFVSRVFLNKYQCGLVVISGGFRDKFLNVSGEKEGEDKRKKGQANK